MFMQEPEQSPYDLRFRLFDTAVRVHPWFWLMTILFNLKLITDQGAVGMLYLGIWTACVFVSILVHEFGHVFMGRYYGSDGYIVLYSFGGLAIGSYPMGGANQRIAVSFAGPAAGFLLFAVTASAAWLYNPTLTQSLLLNLINEPGVGAGGAPDWAIQLIWYLFQINLFWGLMNLLPIWPLDGGQISAELFQKADPNQGLRRALIVSIVTACLFSFQAAISGLRGQPIIPYMPKGDLFQVILFALLAYMSWQALQATGGGGGRYRLEEESYERAPWERDADWWKR